MLQLLRSVPRDFASRTELIDLLTKSGIPMPTAQWMATNLEPAGQRYRWRFDLDAIDEMLRDFFEQDLWPVLEHPPGTLQIHLVKATESGVLSPAAIDRIERLSEDGRIFLHYVTGGHWVNADNPDALLALMTQHL
jgi:hypothetical protein